MDSILIDVKRLCNISPDDDSFDTEIIIHTNSILTILTQDFGVGPAEGFRVINSESVWSDLLPAGNQLEYVKSYLPLRVKLIFDPPTSATAMQALKETISELEWRIIRAVDASN